ncbi:hypothetical protein T484DRAFT_3004553, partial [Baffinella frigidus]
RTSHDPTRSLYVSQPSSCVSCAGSYGSRRGRVWQITSSWSETTHRTTYDERHRHASSSFDRNVGIAHRGVCEREHVADEQGAAAQQAHGEAAGSRNVLWGGLLQDARGLRPPYTRPRNLEHETRNPKPGTRNPETRNPKPGTRNPKPETRNLAETLSPNPKPKP